MIWIKIKRKFGLVWMVDNVLNVKLSKSQSEDCVASQDGNTWLLPRKSAGLPDSLLQEPGI